MLKEEHNFDLMKVGVVVDNDYINDGRVCKEVAFITERYEVDVLCLKYSKNAQKHSNMHPVFLPKKAKDILFALSSWFPLYSFLWTRWIRKFVVENDIDVLHVHDLYMGPPATAAIKKVNKDVKLILDLHENFPATVATYGWTKGFPNKLLTRVSLWKKNEKGILFKSDRIIVLSDLYKKDLLVSYPSLKEENIFIFPNVVDFSKFSSFAIDKTKVRDKRVTYLYFGIVASRRGIFETLDCFKEALETNPNLLLRVIGPVDKADSLRFKKRISTIELKDSIEYIPWIPLEEILTELDRVDVCLAPFHNNEQHNSGIANKIFQYMYAGKPVIVSDCKPQEELVLNANCGRVFRTLDEYIVLLLEMAEDKVLRDQMGERGEAYLHSNYNSENHANRLLQVYVSIDE
ncbi:MAG: glycosyltransferase involved in cell wall biosynthesis [Bacteroidia bacterium]|jgi:glycosyltransferase involved in cell wall biosynthesis